MIDSLAIFHVLKSSKTPLVAAVTGTCSLSLGISFLLILATFSKTLRASSVFPLTRSHRTDSGMNLWTKYMLKKVTKWSSISATLLWRYYGVILCVIIWLAPRAGKMKQILRCDWLPERARWSHLARPGLPAASRRKPYNKSFIDQVCSVKMAGYCPRSFFASLWTSTSSRSINTQKKNLANIQPS